MASSCESAVSYRVQGKVAIVTLDNPKKLNALTTQEYYQLARSLREIDNLKEVCVTVLIGRGPYFSAGANLRSRETVEPDDRPQFYLKNFVSNNLFLTHAVSVHSKVLVAALNGPAVGGSAAVAAFADFVYVAPHTFLYMPFAALGLVAEVGTSRTLAHRLGVSLANEAVLMGKKISAGQLLSCGFASKILDIKEGEDEKFLLLVLQELEPLVKEEVSASSLLTIKQLFRRSERDAVELQNVAEVFAGWDRLSAGLVDDQIRKNFSGRKEKL